MSPRTVLSTSCTRLIERAAGFSTRFNFVLADVAAGADSQSNICRNRSRSCRRPWPGIMAILDTIWALNFWPAPVPDSPAPRATCARLIFDRGSSGPRGFVAALVQAFPTCPACEDYTPVPLRVVPWLKIPKGSAHTRTSATSWEHRPPLREVYATEVCGTWKSYAQFSSNCIVKRRLRGR